MALSLFIQGYFRRTTVKLYKRALKLALQGNYPGALELVAILRHRAFSGAYEVEARIFLAQGQLHEACRVLEEGIAVAPRVWVLHSLLGSCRSDLGEFEAALNHFAATLDCPNLPEAAMEQTHRNQAIVRARQAKL
jgi:tetratricopeptide (TPR) repeat protein